MIPMGFPQHCLKYCLVFRGGGVFFFPKTMAGEVKDKCSYCIFLWYKILIDIIKE